MGKRKLDAPLKLTVKKIKQTGTQQLETAVEETPEDFWKSIEQRISSSFLKVKIQTLGKINFTLKSNGIILLEPLFRSLIIASYSPNPKIPELIVLCLKSLFKTIEPFHFEKHVKSIPLYIDLMYTLLQTKYLIYFQASYEIFDFLTAKESFKAITNKIFEKTFTQNIIDKYRIALKNNKVIFSNTEGKKKDVLKLHKTANLNRFVIFLLEKTISFNLPKEPIVELLSNYCNGLYCLILEPSINNHKNTENQIVDFIERVDLTLDENKIQKPEIDLVYKCIKNKLDELNN